MKKKKYYAITTSMTFEKTVLVPVDFVEDVYDAMGLVDSGVETCDIDLLNQQAYCETKPSSYANENGVLELSDDVAAIYQVLGKRL